ncbi:MAG: hypothetical protein IPL53_09885 [Ignavibacteria bacterium]|nr:hypothetical protein [Ignavibacteria bacterium]
MEMIIAYVVMIVSLVLLLYDYRTGIITSFIIITNFGEFVYLNPNLEIGDFGGLGTIYFMDIFWIAVIIVILLKKDKLYLLNYKISIIIFFFLFLISVSIPFLISSFAVKDLISVIRPMGNFLFLPYFVVTITDIKALNFFEKSIVAISTVFIIIQCYEYVFQSRIPIRIFESNSVYFGEDPYALQIGSITTGYIWSRIGYLLPFNLLFGCYYYFSENRNYGLYLIGIYILSIMISLSRIWIVGFGFFLLIITILILFEKEREKKILVKLFALLGTFVIVGTILIFTSSTFNQIFDIFLLRVNSINDLADKTDSSYISREYTLIQMIKVWSEYPIFGAGFSILSRGLITNDLGLPNLITIFGGAGVVMIIAFIKEFYGNIKPFIQNYYILFVSLFSVMMMITFMYIFSIDMFYFNATGAILFALGNVILNIGKEKS